MSTYMLEKGSSSVKDLEKAARVHDELADRLANEDAGSNDAIVSRLRADDTQVGLALRRRDLVEAARLGADHLDQARAAAARAPGQDQVERELVRALHRSCEVALATHSTHAAASVAAELLQLTRDRLSRHPSSTEALLDVGEALVSASAAHAEAATPAGPGADDHIGALATELVAIAEQLLQHDPRSLDAAALHWRGLAHLADVAVAGNRWADARSLYDQAYAIRHRIQKQDRSNEIAEIQDLKRKLLLAKVWAKGGVLGRRLALEEDYKRVVAIQDRCAALGDRASAALRGGDPQLASDLASESIQIERGTLASLTSPDPDLVSWMSADLVVFGRAQLAMESFEAARSSLTEAAGIDVARAHEHPKDAEACRTYFHSLRHLGRAVRKLGDPGAEIQRSIDFVAAARAWLTADPSSQQARVGLADALEDAGIAHSQLGLAEQAFRFMEDAVSVVDDLVAAGDDRIDHDVRRGMLLRAGGIAAAAGMHDRARTHFDACARIARAQLAEDPAGTRVRDTLRSALQGAGEAASVEGDVDHARACFDEADRI